MKRTLLVACLAAMLTACHNFKLIQLETAEVAAQLPSQGWEEPSVVRSVPIGMQAIPYAILHCDFDGIPPEGAQAWNIRGEISERGETPDLVVFYPQGAAYAGSVTTVTPIGFGAFFASSSPVHRQQTIGVLMRLVPWHVGLGWNDQYMVVEVSDQTRESGIQEGDTLISIDGRAITIDEKTGVRPVHHLAAQLQPGDEVKLVWIRPGTGRMEGQVVLQATSVPDQPASMDDEYRRKREARDQFKAKMRHRIWESP